MPSKAKKKVFITGGSGLVGSNLVYWGKAKYDITSTYFSFPCFLDVCQMEKASLTDKKVYEKMLTKYRPDFVIHSAAYTDLAGCETNIDRARQINAQATKNIAETCEKIGAKLVYISTDWVFDGKKVGKYTEKDKPAPINSYGQSKLDGESVLPKDGNWIIARIANVYGWNYAISIKSLLENHDSLFGRSGWAIQILHQLMRGKSIRMPGQIYQTPTLASDLAEKIFDMCEQDMQGLFHVCGTTCVNRYQFVVQMAKKFGLNPDLVKSGTVDDLVVTWGVDLKKLPYFSQTIPANTCLDTTKLKEALTEKLVGLKEGLQIMKSQLLEAGFFD